MILTRNSRSTHKAFYCAAVVFFAAGILMFINSSVSSGVTAAQDGPVAETTSATFSNSTAIAISDVGAVNGDPYPSTINVSGLSGNIANSAGSVKVTINNFSHTFNSDVVIALVGPGGQAIMIQGRAGLGDPESNVTYTISDTGSQTIPDPGWGPGTYKPTNWAALTTSFPAPGPGTAWANPGPGGSGTATLTSVFGNTAPNGTWSLYVRDLFDQDGGSIAGGWTLEITTSGGAAGPDAQGDYDGDGKTDYAVVRNAGGINGQITWFISDNATGTPRSQAWGLGSDWFVPADYDGDGKDDIAVWRPGIQSTFNIIQSSNNTLKTVEFGTQSDNPSVVGDYNNDGTDDLAVYRPGATPGAQSFFFVSYGGTVYSQAWGLNGDTPAPGDYDGDGRMDYAVQRAESGNGVFYIRYTAPQADTVTTFGLGSDIIVPGNYDGDTKTDLAVMRANGGGFWNWIYRPSGGGGDVTDEWGIVATDYPVPGDYNGDGKADYAIWRPGATPGSNSTFWVMRPITRVIETRQYGLSEDAPVNLTYAHY
jgi:subtilisin-like proprotein convertase family protein